MTTCTVQAKINLKKGVVNLVSSGYYGPPSESFQGSLVGSPLGRGLDSHAVTSVCL